MPEEDNNSAPKTPEPQKPTEPPTQKVEAAAPPEDPIREILDQLRQSQGKITDPKLASQVQGLVWQATEPMRVNRREFQHEAAYVLQDIERQLGTLGLSPPARLVADRLATSVPNLENEQLIALMRATAHMNDPKAVQAIRRVAKEAGRQVDQNTSITQEQIAQIENSVRLEPHPGAATGTPPSQQAAQQPSQAATPKAGNRDEETQQQPVVEANSTARPQAQFAGQSQQAGNSKVLHGLAGSQQRAPWQPEYTPLAGRLSAFQAALRTGRDDIAIRDAEKAAQAAFDALHGFRVGQGATVMNRISAAARSEGLSTVLSEMREGGRFESLRHDFDSALKHEEGFARAYDKAASALAQYGETRTNLEQLIAHRPDAANLTEKFQKLDAEIGQVAEEIPSRRQGKNMLDDITKRASEVIHKAVDAFRAIVSRNAANPSVSSPSPGPR